MMAASKGYRKVFERAAPDHPLTPHKLCLLRWVAECGLLTVAQLSGLSDLSEKSVRGHMRDLFDLGLVDRIGVPRAALADVGAPNSPSLLWGRAPAVYSLSRLGIRCLGDSGLLDPPRPPCFERYGPKNHLFLAHEVEIRDVRVWLERLRWTYAHPGVSRWFSGSDAKAGPARPDAWFVYEMPSATLVAFVEVDRGTERSPSRWREKFRNYEKLLTGSTVSDLTGYSQARVLVIAPDARRRDDIGSVITACLPGSSIQPDRFWLSAKGVMKDASFTEGVWRVPGRPELMPMVPQTILGSPTVQSTIALQPARRS
jgi:hypothetical protein